ncbi:MAG TPA: hypothetical protein VFZ61_17385 [Polyangiales bacterium]
MALAVGSLHGAACAPDEGEPAYTDRDAALETVTPAHDSGPPTTPGAMANDAAVPLDASEADARAQRDAADRGTDPLADASSLDADIAILDASHADAAPSPDAGSDSSVPTTARHSAGCGKSGRPSGGRVSVQGERNYTFPATYDGKRPFPLLIGFHAAGNPIEQIEILTKGSGLEQSYVRAFPKSRGSAWDYAADIGKVTAMYEDLLANHCVDTSRVFATGHSSGAQLIVQILTPAHKADADRFRFKAVAPVAASRYGGVSREIPVMYIQGAHDNVRNSDGSDVVKEFTSVNGCAARSTPYTAVQACSSGGKSVKAGCVQYEACKQPTVWCSHDDPQYSNTNHGWPCFAATAMHDFFEGLP